ncbi:MAG: DUF4291 domain-containing protein [Bacteroidota bacterium]
MKIELDNYENQVKHWPKEGYHIMAQYDHEKIIVYQAYRPEIGNFAVKEQYFGGAFSFNRMTWIKPNFLWMMYRNGWGQKEGQEITLAIHLRIEAFIKYLKQSIYSSFQNSGFTDHHTWKHALESSSCRLQWDPDHDPYGQKLPRRAIQIGIRNELIIQYSREDIIEIEDISPFVKEQHNHVKQNELDMLLTPKETPLIFDDTELNVHLKISNQ